jgi:3'(2'), 5'-bisphosphate nucleotidase
MEQTLVIELQPILDAVRTAAILTRRVQRAHFASSHKAGREPVTIADYGSQAIICRMLAQAYPDDAVLAEECGEQFMALVSDADRAQVVTLVGDALGESVSEAQVVAWLDHGRGRDGARAWLVDPIDGTLGFIALRRYSIAVGVVEGGLPIAGVLGSPGYPSADGYGLLFHGQGSAAYAEPLNPAGRSRPARIAVAARCKPAQMRVVESVEGANADLEAAGRVYQAVGIRPANVHGVDSQDKYAMVACGDADLYMRLPVSDEYTHRAWDHAAGTALVQAAGGVVTDLDGSPLDFSHGAALPNNRGMIISSGPAHDQIVEAVQALWNQPPTDVLE